MQTVNPGQTVVSTEAGLPTGQTVGFQLLKATTGSVAIARTTLGVFERPAGSGNYVVTYVAPAEGDLYLLVLDWTGGVLAPETTRVSDLLVTTTVTAGSSGLGAIADYAKMYLGGDTWRGLVGSADYGEPAIARAIDLVKRRVLTTPPATNDEVGLNPLVLDYLGISAALQVIPSARDFWGSKHLSISQGDDPTEVVTYVNRAKLMDDLRDDLMRRLPVIQAAALPHITDPVLQAAGDGPAIDEEDDARVTEDPRCFPTAADFPGDPLYADLYGYASPRRSGVPL